MVSLINYLDEYFLEGSAEGRPAPVCVESSGASDVRRSMRKGMVFFFPLYIVGECTKFAAALSLTSHLDWKPVALPESPRPTVPGWGS